METPDHCPVCVQRNTYCVSTNSDLSQFEVKCMYCGLYRIDPELIAKFGVTNEQRGLLSGVLRSRSELGVTLSLTIENYKDIEAFAPRRLESRIEELLRVYARRTPFLGAPSEFITRYDYPLGYAQNESEIRSMTNYLAQNGWVESDVDIPRLTCAGLVHAEKIGLRNTHKGFVAMWFDPKMTPIYEQGIKPAIEDAGYAPDRVDGIEHVGKIDDRIIAEIRESRFIVADFTGHRGGVYFEAGYALGLGLPVIWTCRKTDVKKLHFDIRQYNCITWSSPEELRTRLFERIRVAVGFGPNRPS